MSRIPLLVLLMLLVFAVRAPAQDGPVTGAPVGEYAQPEWDPPIAGEPVYGEPEWDPPVAAEPVSGEPEWDPPVGGGPAYGGPVEEGRPVGGEPLY